MADMAEMALRQTRTAIKAVKKVPGLANKRVVDLSAAELARMVRDLIANTGRDTFVKLGVPKKRVGAVKKFYMSIFKDGKTLAKTCNMSLKFKTEPQSELLKGVTKLFTNKGQLTAAAKKAAIRDLASKGLPADTTVMQHFQYTLGHVKEAMETFFKQAGK